jgi:hypothetical protein
MKRNVFTEECLSISYNAHDTSHHKYIIWVTMLVYGENKFFNIYFFILGCPNGTFGYKCERVCDSNHYGILCQSTCDCKSNET